MATDSILGLFTTPEQYQQAQLQQLYGNQLAQARLSPVEQASFNIGAGAQRAGDVLGRALGGEDPMLKLQSTRTAIMQKVDQTDPQSLVQAAQALNQAGDIQGARALVQAAQQAALTQSQITKNLREGRAAQTKLQEVGVAEGTREPVYTYQTPQGVSQVVFKNVNGQQQMVPFTGGVDRTTAKTNIGGIKLPEGESEFVKELGKLDAKQVVDATKTREAAIGELDTLKKMSELNRQQMTTGTFASGRVAVGNLLGTIGIASDKDKLATAKSEEYQKYAGNLLLDKIKKLGTNPSNTDREFIARIIPQLENVPQARQELIDYMAKRANEVIGEATRLEQYARQNRGLGGYKPTVPLVSTGGVASLSDDELIRQIRAERNKQGSK
jgi:hypothetical protein